MKIDSLFFQLAIVFLPGLIWAQLDARYAMKEKPGPAEFLVRAFMFGLVTYLGVYLGYGWLGREFSLPVISDSDSPKFLTADFSDEILTSIPVSFALAVVWLYAGTYRWLTRLLHGIGATKKYGDEDVWDLTFNSREVETEYVHVRDFDKRIIYAGWVSAFSETEKLREILLRDAIVYYETDQKTEVPWLYIARDKTDIHIEFPSQERGDEG